MREFYVYGHYMDGSEKPFYIGKGRGNRAYEQYSRSDEWKNIVNQCEVKVDILYDGLTEQEAFELEKNLIKEFGRLDLNTGCLVNKTDGGDGISGQVYTDARREKVRNSAKRSIVDRLGEQKAKEYIEKQSKTRKELYATGKIIPYWKGKRRHKNTIEKIRQSKLGKPTSKKGKGKIVQQFDLTNTLIAEYASVANASDQLNIPTQTIYTSIKRNGKTNGYIFKYK